MNDIEKKIEEIIKEDVVNMGTSPESPGYGWMNRKLPMHMSVLDILKMDKSDLDKAMAVMPHQTTPIFDKLVKMIDDILIMRNEFKNILQHPLVRNDEEKKQAIKKSRDRLGKIAEVYRNMISELQKLKLD